MKNYGIFKKAAPVLLSAAMLLGFSGVSFAATSKEQITDVTVSISYELSNGMTKSDIDADCTNDGVDTVTVSSVTNNEYGKKPKVTIKLKADSDYTFKGISKSDVTITGDDATLTKVSSGTSSVTLTLTLPKIGTTDETSLEISDVSWGEDDDGRVEWEQADDADKYEVRLLRGTSTRETVTTTGTDYNFRSAIRSNGKGTYRVKVRAMAGSYKGSWTESDDFEVDEDVLDDLGGKSSSRSSSNSSSSSGNNSSNSGSSSYGSGPSNGGSSKGAWLKDSNGWWYCNADRSYTTNNWQQIDGYWYYFNQYGYMRTGWLQSPYSQKWYYLNPAEGNSYGRMLTSQWVDNGKYYVNADGVWDGQTR